MFITKLFQFWTLILKLRHYGTKFSQGSLIYRAFFLACKLPYIEMKCDNKSVIMTFPSTCHLYFWVIIHSSSKYGQGFLRWKALTFYISGQMNFRKASRFWGMPQLNPRLKSGAHIQAKFQYTVRIFQLHKLLMSKSMSFSANGLIQCKKYSKSWEILMWRIDDYAMFFINIKEKKYIIKSGSKKNVFLWNSATFA